MLLIVGLGNPGPNYLGNRHNIGFLALDEIASSYKFPAFTSSKISNSLASLHVISDEKILLMKPLTFMNVSGNSVRSAIDFFKISPDQILVIHDDLDLPPGEVRFKKGGGHGGHNGLRSITERIGADYYRLRLGIGHPGDKSLVSDYVLSNFSPKDTWVEPVIQGVGILFHHLIAGDKFTESKTFTDELK